MAAGELERAFALSPLGDGRWSAQADPGYEAVNGMLGGWTAAIALGAVSESARGNARPSAITINFVGQIEPGSEVHVQARRVGGGRSVSHWQSEMTSPETADVLAYASVVLTERRDSDGRVDVEMPEAPEPDTCEVFHPPGPFGERTIIRTVEGFPPYGRADTRSLGWVREMSGRAVDQLQLAYLSDVRPPRSFFWSDGPRVSATLTLSVYFHANESELAEAGDDFLLSEAFGTRGADSTSEEHVRLWSRQGALLAASQ